MVAVSEPSPRAALAGRRVLLTGATGGIGTALAEEFAAAGARLVLVARDSDRLAALATRFGVEPVVADLASAADVTRVAGAVREVDVVVHSAGVGWAGELTGMGSEDVERLLAVNLRAPVELTRLLLPALLRSPRGHVVFVASVAGRLGVRGEAVYGATKAGLEHFAEALRLEVAGRGVRVSTVTPAAVATDFFDHRGTPYRRRFPRPMPAERVAHAVLDAVVRGRAEVLLPGWLGVPVRLRALAPGLYRWMSDRAQ